MEKMDRGWHGIGQTHYVQFQNSQTIFKKEHMKEVEKKMWWRDRREIKG